MTATTVDYAAQNADAKAKALQAYQMICEAYDSMVIPPASSGDRQEAQRLYQSLQGAKLNLGHQLVSLGLLQSVSE